jgi:hypothetical protein
VVLEQSVGDGAGLVGRDGVGGHCADEVGLGEDLRL